MIRRLANGAYMSWDYEPTIKLLTAVITDVVAGEPVVLCTDAVIVEPEPDWTEGDYIRDALNRFSSEYLANPDSGLDFGEVGEDKTVCVIIADVECDLCTHVWRAQFPDELDKLECPNCENMVNFEIKE